MAVSQPSFKNFCKLAMRITYVILNIVYNIGNKTENLHNWNFFFTVPVRYDCLLPKNTGY